VANARVVVIDRDNLTREGLTAILSRNGFLVVGSMASIKEACSTVTGQSPPDLVLFCCHSDTDGAFLELMRLRHNFSDSKLVALSDCSDLQFIVNSFQISVDGVISRGAARPVMLTSLRLVLAGEPVFPAIFVGALLNCAHIFTPGHTEDWPQDRLAKLSERERYILRLLVTGESNKAIGLALNITEATVKVHVRNMLRKLKLQNRTQAAVWAAANGIMHAGPAMADPDPI